MLLLNWKGVACKQVKQIKCSKINHTERLLDQLAGNTVRKKRFSDTGVAVKEEIFKRRAEIADERLAFSSAAAAALREVSGVPVLVRLSE